MRQLRRVLFLLALFAATSMSAIAATPEVSPLNSIRAAIEVAYTGFNTAYTQRDLNRAMTYFTPDYLLVDEKGQKSNQDQARQQYRDQLKPIKTMQMQTTIENVVATTGGALVEAKVHTSGSAEKRMLFARMQATFTDDLWVRDEWVNTAQGWRIKSRHLLRNDRKIHPK